MRLDGLERSHHLNGEIGTFTCSKGHRVIVSLHKTGKVCIAFEDKRFATSKAIACLRYRAVLTMNVWFVMLLPRVIYGNIPAFI